MAQMATCKICGIEFKDSHPAKKINKFCCREHWLKHLREKGSWNKGKKWDEMYDKDTLDKLKTRITATGEDHHLYGIKRPDIVLSNILNNPMYTEEKKKEILDMIDKNTSHKVILKLMNDMTGHRNYQYQRKCFKRYGRKCIECGKTEKEIIIGVHHLDGNHKNNKIENIRPYCNSCHTKLHWKLRKEKEVNTNDNI